MNIEQARFNMVEQQIRPWDVLDFTVLDLLYEVKREDFVPSQYQSMAFMDTEIPLAHGESMLSPKLEARLLQSLALKENHKVLEIGTGSGYMAALMSRLAHSVTTLEIHHDLAQQAQARLTRHGHHNVSVVIGDGAQGYGEALSWDAILLSGSVPQLPQVFLDSLAVGGVLIAVVGFAPTMFVTRYKRLSEKDYHSEVLFETVIPALHHIGKASRFEF
ncbi:MAG: protein-L-isoaspartate O-methyltransferase [Betaproteobacteria bacterium]|nr:protein-L-isoaspartate O-methyltransferase [Betaproteobacteria bacterium]